MAQLGYTFDASLIEPSAPRGEVIPAGEYVVQIVKSDMAPTKNGAGQKLDLELEVLEGPHAKRHLWDLLNLVNPSQQAQEIAQRTLSSICHAVGVLNVSNSEQLHWLPMIAVVRVKPADANYPAKNEIGGYKPAPGARATAPSTPRPAAPSTPRQAAPAAAPWKRGAAA